MMPDDRPEPDEFYVGYEPDMPPRMAVHLARVVTAVVALALLTAGAATALHRRLAPATFEFGRPQAITGELRRAPYPRLIAAGRTAWLVGPGKAGAEAVLDGATDGPVALEGTRIARGPHTMFEVVAGSVRSAPAGTKSVPSASGTDGTNLVPPDAETAARQVHGGDEIDVQGEIVDSKCFLGVMNPGEGTVHRDCARVCLRGGIPPMLLVRGAAGEEALMLLVGATGEPIGRQLAARAGQPVVIRGRLSRDGDTLVLVTTIGAVTPLGGADQ
jgi:hypothetical protein